MREKERDSMGDPKIFLHELEILINQQVQYVMGMAARCPKEGCDEWDRLLSRYGVEKMQPQCSGPTVNGARGAPPHELKAVLVAIRQMALPALSHIEYQHARLISGNPLLRSWVRRIHERLSSLEKLCTDSSEPSSPARWDTPWSQAAAF